MTVMGVIYYRVLQAYLIPSTEKTNVVGNGKYKIDGSQRYRIYGVYTMLPMSPY